MKSRVGDLSGGKLLQTFDTDCAKVGVLICYDVEFPELSRLMADQGMQILFVPFLTDTQNAYSRVRVCAQARAIENECFVVIAGCVGNLPRVHNMDIQYAQSGVFTPCDFAFPTDGKRAEATPNTEMILVSDVDLDLLNALHTYGSVRNLKDRRNDVYEVRTEEVKGGLFSWFQIKTHRWFKTNAGFPLQTRERLWFKTNKRNAFLPFAKMCRFRIC